MQTKAINYRMTSKNGSLARSAYIVRYDANTLPTKEKFYDNITAASAGRLIRLANGGNGDDTIDIVPMLNGWLAVIND